MLAVSAAAGFASGCSPSSFARDEPVDRRVLIRAHAPLKLAVEDTGRGEPIVLLHGLGQSSYSWRFLVPTLAQTHRVISIDLKGFGNSDKPADEKYSVIDQAKLIRAFIEQQNLKNVTVIGHSYGGGVTLALALDLASSKSKRLKQIVLMDSIAYRQPLPLAFQLLTTPGVGQAGMALIPPDVQVSQALKIAFYDHGKITADAIAAYAQPLQTQDGRDALRQTVEHLEPPDLDEFIQRYRTLKIRSLVVWCERDKIIPLDYGRRLAQDIHATKLHVIRDCGHLPQEEQPGDTLMAIAQFLR